jgi:hypothetical protein
LAGAIEGMPPIIVMDFLAFGNKVTHILAYN